MNIEAAQKIKGLETRKKKVKSELDFLKEEKKRIQSEISQKEQQHGQLAKQIKDICDAEIVSAPIITEHALLRFFERVAGFDMTSIADEILPNDAIPNIQKLGSGRYPITRKKDGGTHYLRVKDGKVVTLET